TNTLTLIDDVIPSALSRDGTIVVGTKNDGEAVYWTAETGTVGIGFLTGATDSWARAISADNQVIVGGSGNQAFRWTSTDGMVPLGNLTDGVETTIATGVSADGDIIVGTSIIGGETEAFIWNSTNGMRSLKAVLEADGADLSGWSL